MFLQLVLHGLQNFEKKIIKDVAESATKDNDCYSNFHLKTRLWRQNDRNLNNLSIMPDKLF